MQDSVALVRLSPLALIPRDTVPWARRKEITELTERRQAARGRIVSGAVLTFITGLFFLLYGAGAVFAWSNGGHAAFRLLLSIASAGMLVANRCVLSQMLGNIGEYRILVAPPDLLRAARIEQTLDEAVRALNAKALDWNEASSIAEANDVDERYIARLRSHREDLERRREVIVTGLARAWVSAASAETEPKALPPPSDWGHVVHIDLKSR